jgi:hypothetical protein
MSTVSLFSGLDLPCLPYESDRSVLARFAWRHGLSWQQMKQHGGPTNWGVRYSLAGERPISWQQLGFIRDALRKLNAREPFSRNSISNIAQAGWIEPLDRFRFCPICLEECYHSYIFHWMRLHTCPIHGCALYSTCLSCGAPVGSRCNPLIGNPAYRCVRCHGPISGAEPNLLLHRQLQENAAWLQGALEASICRFEMLSDRLDKVLVPVRLIAEQSAMSVRRWGRFDHILKAAELVVEDGPLPKGTTQRVGMTFISWRVVSELPEGGPLVALDTRLRASREKLLPVYLATLRRIQQWLFDGGSLEAAERRMYSTFYRQEKVGYVGDWNRLELSYILFRLSMEVRDVRPCYKSVQIILRGWQRSLDQWTYHGALPRIAYRAWLLAAFAIIHAYISQHANSTIEEVLMVPGFPDSLIPTMSSSGNPTTTIGGVYFPSLQGMPMYPFRPG